MIPQLREIVVDNGEFVFIPEDLSDEEVAQALKQANQAFFKRGEKATTLEELFEAYEAFDYRYAVNAPEAERLWQARLRRFENNATLGDPLATAAQACCLVKGLGTQKDTAKAYILAQQAFDSGHPAGRHVLADCFRWGYGVERNQAVAERLFEEASALNFTLSQIWEIGKRLQSNPNDQEATNDAVAAYKKGLAEGSNLCRVLLADTYSGLWGPGSPQDLTKARNILLPAAEEGYPTAQFNLWQLYSTALQVRDPKLSAGAVDEARRWLIAAAEGGHDAAQWMLAIHHLQEAGYQPPVNLGITRDYTDARKWADLAARQDNRDAQLLLATIYFNGLAVERDYEKARTLVEKAAAANLPDAFVQQGLWYWEGSVYPRDDTKAQQLFKKAADMGSPDGCFRLAQFYDDGQGLQALALHWYVQAALKGHPEAVLAVRPDKQSERRSWWYTAVNDLKKHFPDSHDAYLHIAHKKNWRASLLCKEGTDFAKKGDYPRATEVLSQAAEIASAAVMSEETVVNLEDLHCALMHRGLAYYLDDKLDEAKRDLDEAVETSERIMAKKGEVGAQRGLARTLSNRGVVHRARGALQDAIDDYTRALDIYRELAVECGSAKCVDMHADILMNLGNALLDVGQYAAAVEKFDGAIQLYTRAAQQSDDPEMWKKTAQTIHARGLTRFKQQRFAEAILDFDKAGEAYTELNEKRPAFDISSELAEVRRWRQQAMDKEAALRQSESE
jgi:TPR repeat protein